MLSPNVAKPTPVDSDVNITKENQKKINLFAIRNGWVEELKEELEAKKNLLKNLQDAESDIMLLDDQPVSIMIGESFVEYQQEKGLAKITNLQSRTSDEISALNDKISEIKSEMSSLKAELYAQFGDSINLECEEKE